MKKILSYAMAFALLLATAGPTQALNIYNDQYYGHWEYRNNPGGSELLILGDDDGGVGLVLRGTRGYCELRGSSYAKMRSVLSNNDRDKIDWYIDYDCPTLIRVCVRNKYGEQACSSYRRGRWISYP